MVLVLKNEQLEDLVPMTDEIDAIEQAYREMGEGSAVNSPRARLRVQAPGKKPGFQYYFNNIMGLVPGMKSMGLRIDSTFSDEEEVAGTKRRIYPGDYVGLVFLFDMEGLLAAVHHGRPLHFHLPCRRHQRRGGQALGARGRQGHGGWWAPGSRPRPSSWRPAPCASSTRSRCSAPPAPTANASPRR